MTKSKYLPVNWIDGMRISKDHFIASENAMTERIHQAGVITLNRFNYGLLAPVSDSDISLKITTEIDARNLLHVRLNTCWAVTRGGIFIDISHVTGDQSVFELPLNEATLDIEGAKDDNYYIILTVNPFLRVPAGQADPEENPPRNPYIIPEYKLDIVPAQNITASAIGGNYLVIGHLTVKDKKSELSDSFIPPCTQVRSHPALIDLHDKILHFLTDLERDSLEIISKVYMKRQKSTLSETVLSFNKQLIVFVSQQVSVHKWTMLDLPPVYMLESVSRLSRIIMNITQSYTREYKEEMVNYYSDWCNLRQGEFMEILSGALKVNYLHENIRETITPLMNFIKMISEIYKTMAGLDYIGKLKDVTFAITEKIKDEEKVELKKKRPSIYQDDNDND
jgi:hypothetical protein